VAVPYYVGQPAQSIPLLRAALRRNPDGGYLYFLSARRDGVAYLFVKTSAGPDQPA
jgi:hypothetical protein